MCEPDSIPWRDIGLVGALCEELTAEQAQERLMKELQPDDGDEEQ